MVSCMVCLHPFWLRREGFPVACGRCVACKIMRTHEWAMRLVMEREYWNDAAFVTLTYRDVDLPPTLRPRHLQLYIKRLRKALGEERKIKYFGCGEYGDKGGVVQEGPRAGQFVHRPHYHAIIFGLSPVNDRQLIMDKWPYADWQELESTYRGRKAVGTVTYDSCRYVSGYVQKKLYGKKAKEEFESSGQIQPFSRKSQGLGLQFALDNKSILEDSLVVGCRGYSVALPRYFRDKLNIDPQRIAAKHWEDVKDDYEAFLKQKHLQDSPDARVQYAYFGEYRNPLNIQFRAQREKDLFAKMRNYRGELEFDL